MLNGHDKTQRGQTLVQLLVALAISLVLLLGIGQIFISGKQSYRTNEALSRVQESGRFADNFIGRDIRMAGFLGCDAREHSNNVSDNTTGTSPDVQAALSMPGRSVQGFDVEGSSLPATLSSLGLSLGTSPGDATQVRPNTEAIVIRRARPCAGGALTTDAPAGGPLTVADAGQCGFQPNQIALVTDCLDADLFTIGGVSGEQITPSATLSKAYPEVSAVYLYETNAYYIGTNDNGEPALYRRGIAGTGMQSEELVEGIEDLAAWYGESTSGGEDVETYRTAGAVGDWAEVRSVRYSLSARSVTNNVTENEQSYDLGDDDGEITPGDNRLRRQFGSTAAMRNRLP